MEREGVVRRIFLVMAGERLTAEAEAQFRYLNGSKPWYAWYVPAVG